jgi:transcriptional regulator with PAS, ATPase and Fis domain
MDQEINPFLLENLIRPFKESLMIVDRHGKILFVTDHSKKVFREKELIGKNFTSIIFEEDNQFKDWLGDIQSFQSDFFRFNIKRGNHLFPIVLNALSYRGSDGELLVLLSMKDDLELQMRLRGSQSGTKYAEAYRITRHFIN